MYDLRTIRANVWDNDYICSELEYSTVMDKNIEQDYEFQVLTSDFSDMIGKTHFIPNLNFLRCISGSSIIAVNSTDHTFAEGHSFVLSEYTTFQVKEKTADFSVTTISISLPFYYEIVAGFDGNIFNVLLQSVPELYKSSDLEAANLLFENLCLLYSKKKHRNRRSMAMNLIACYLFEIYELPFLISEENPLTRKITCFQILLPHSIIWFPFMVLKTET